MNKSELTQKEAQKKGKRQGNLSSIEQEKLERRKAMPPKEHYFAVYFDQEGGIIKVEKDGKEVVVEQIDGKKNLPPFSKLDFYAVGHTPKGSPCCFISGSGYRYCWPPCV